MDKVNKVMLADDSLTYKYRGDPNIHLGVLGMVDDILAISHCGIASIKKNHEFLYRTTNINNVQN